MADKRGNLAGEEWKTLDFSMTPPNYERFRREGVSWTQRVDLTSGPPTHVKTILYQYDADALGSRTFEVKDVKPRR